ncbi:MAG: hypothetical protein JNM52_04675, partial [Betaproteobacteria bacterium]|nr:hypothetical protein [Betaproteobacteria bacterium]
MAIHESFRLSPANVLETCPYGYMFMRYALVQLSMKGNQTKQDVLADILVEVSHCRNLHRDNRRIDLLADLIEGSVKAAKTAYRSTGLDQLYTALHKASYVNDLTVDALSCLVQAEFLAGRTDKMKQHLESWIARTYEDARWQAAEKLGLHNTRRIGQVLQEQWPELQLGEQKLTQSLMSGPPLPPGLMERFSDWVAQEAENDIRTVDISLVLKGELVRLPLLRLLAEGLDKQQIAARLCLTERSVKTMLLRLYRALGVADREAAIAYWQEHHQSLTEAARNQPSCLSWYRACLLRHEFEAALLHWHNTPPHLRDSRARLLICLMLSLLKREDAAAKESAYLLPADAALFLPFNDWWQGDEAALPPLLQVANATAASRSNCLKLALYFGCTLRKQYKHAAALIGALKTGLGATPALVGEGQAPCPDAG